MYFFLLMKNIYNAYSLSKNGNKQAFDLLNDAKLNIGIGITFFRI